MAGDLEPIVLDIDLFSQGRCRLPALPNVVHEVIAASQDPSASPEKVGDLVARDPGLASQVLAVINSPYYALPNPVGNLRYAVAYLGLGEVSRIVLTQSVATAFSEVDAAKVRPIWVHSYLVALLARRLIAQFNVPCDSRDLYAAALLHDMGKLVYAVFFPDHFDALAAHAEEHHCRFSDAEEALDVPPHRAMGALLCDHWKLPPTLKRACLHHEV